jgi:hypothetical protein
MLADADAGTVCDRRVHEERLFLPRLFHRVPFLVELRELVAGEQAAHVGDFRRVERENVVDGSAFAKLDAEGQVVEQVHVEELIDLRRCFRRGPGGFGAHRCGE